MKGIPVATAATVWTCPETGERYLLLIHEALFFGERMKHSLICPNQLRAHGATVEDGPRQFDKKSRHAIQLPNDPPTTIPLELRGIISFFETTKPTSSQLEDLPRLELTSPLPWDPYSPQFVVTEETFDKVAWDSERAPNETGPSIIAGVQSAESRDNTLWNETRCVSAVFASLEAHDCVEYTSEEDLYQRLVATIHVAADDVPGDGMSGRADADIRMNGDNYLLYRVPKSAL